MTIGRLVRDRLALLVLVLLGVSVITFAISHLIPSDPARLIAGDFASPETVESIRQELGLDRPLPVQYGRYLASLLRGDLGVSIRSGVPVAAELWRYFPATLELTLVAMVLSGVLGVLFGVLAAAYRDRWPDHVLRLLALTGVSTPSFWLALVLIYVFFGMFGWFPAGGRIDPSLADFPRVTGLYTVDSLLALRPDAFLSTLHHLLLPAVSLSILNLGAFSRLVRASMLEELGKDYVLTARAAGLSGGSVFCRHALRNALIPFVTVFGLSFGYLLTGAVVTEAVFTWPGMGSYILEAIDSLDFPAIMGFTVFTGALYVLVNLVVDLVYLLLDPRQRVG